jgi:transcriptional regulator with XRE-family HTH domain
MSAFSSFVKFIQEFSRYILILSGNFTKFLGIVMAKMKKAELGRYRNVISQNVRKIRGEMGQTEFAKKAGISVATVHRIESCKNFQADNLLRIALAFDVLPYELCLTEEERRKLHLSTDAVFQSFKEIIKNEIVQELKKGGG